MVTKTNSEQSLIAANSLATNIGGGGALEEQISSLLAQNKSPSQLTGLDSLALAAPAALQSLSGPTVSNDTVDYFQQLTANAQGFTPAAAFAGELAGTRDRQQSLVAQNQSVSDAFRVTGENRQAENDRNVQALQQQQDFNLRLQQHNDDQFQRQVENQSAAEQLSLSAEGLATDTFFKSANLQDNRDSFAASRSDAAFGQGVSSREQNRLDEQLSARQTQERLQNDLDQQKFSLQRKQVRQQQTMNLLQAGHSQQQLGLQIKQQIQAEKEYKDAAPLRDLNVEKTTKQVEAFDLQRQQALEEIEVVRLQRGEAEALKQARAFEGEQATRTRTAMQTYMNEIQRGRTEGGIDAEGNYIEPQQALPYNELVKAVQAKYGQQLLIMSPTVHQELSGIVASVVEQENDTTRANKVSGGGDSGSAFNPFEGSAQ